MLKEIINARNLPVFKSREEMLRILQEEEYGYMPPNPDSIRFEVTEKYIPSFCAGKAVANKVDIITQIGGKEFTFSAYATIPTRMGKHPFFVCINFRPDIPDRFIPSEELVDNGFAVLSFCNTDVTQDNNDFTDGLTGVLFENGERKCNDAGKLAMWAWAAQRVMDYACTLDCLDMERSVVCGHSRLGKTALLAAATDERFKFAFSNNSGCSGAAISRGKMGEQVKDICHYFPYWFCENYKKHIGKEAGMPFDQHYLAAAIAPRYLYVSSAKEDTWADPDSEMLNCVAVSSVYEKLGKTGFVCEDRFPEVGDVYHDGYVGYHLREGLHYLGREDWQKVISFINRHR